MLINTNSLPFCVRLRTENILSSKIRYFDLSILVPNVIFLLFITIQWIRTRTKLNRDRPLLLSLTCLLIIITLISISRCLFVFIFPEQSFRYQEIFAKILWLAVQFTILWTELSIILFGIYFGRSNSKHQSVKVVKALIISFTFTFFYTVIQGILEIRSDTRPVQFQTSKYNLYSYGGMKFLLVSSSILFTVYTFIFSILCFYRQNQKHFPIRRSFYFYCFVLAFINLTQIIGTVLNLTETTIFSSCMVDGVTWLFEVTFAPLVYYQFLRRALCVKVLIPEIIYADTAIYNDEDDPLIDPTNDSSNDNSKSHKLDGQFEDITSSTKIIDPII